MSREGREGRAACGPRGDREGPILSGNTCAGAGLGRMSAPEEAGTAGQSAAQEERPAVCDEALRTGRGSGKCESTSARTGRPAWRPARCLPGRARGPRRKAAGRSCCRRGRTGARGTATREAAAQEARPAAAGGAERRAQSTEQREYRPLPPRCERALSAGYWPGQTTPPVRTGPAGHAVSRRLARPRHRRTQPHASRKETEHRTKLPQPERQPLARLVWGCVAAAATAPPTGRARPVGGAPPGLAVPDATAQVPSAVQASCPRSGRNH